MGQVIKEGRISGPREGVTMQLTYRKCLNRGWEPVIYHTDKGSRTAAIIKRGPKWLTIKWGDGSGNKRVKIAEERYMRHMTSKRG